MVLHVVESTKETVQLGVFDATLPPILTIESGDRVSFPNTWSHFLNGMQPGVPVDRLADWRKANPGKGPHSIIGPIAVKDAAPGDVLEIRYERLRPFGWGAVFHNPAALGTGLLPEDFPQGQVKYLDLDLARRSAKFATDINVPLRPFQGTLGVAPPDGFFPPLRPGVTSSVPPGPHAGNTDLRRLRAIIDLGRGDIPLKDLKFRCTKCGSSLTDSVVMARDALRVQPWRGDGADPASAIFKVRL